VATAESATDLIIANNTEEQVSQISEKPALYYFLVDLNFMFYILLKLRTSKITVHLENSIENAPKVTKSSSF